jgi:tetratricopeptide (TPR) repeat protein
MTMAEPHAMLEPPHVVPSIQQALTLHQQGRLGEAERIYTAILGADPDQFDALHLCGVLWHQQGRSIEALRLVAAALRANPRSVDALSNYGVILQALERHAEALAIFDQALRLQADEVGVLYNRGNALKALKRPAEALASYDRALARDQGHIDALLNRADILMAFRRHAEALASYDGVLQRTPSHAQALNNRSVALFELKRFEEALASASAALTAKPRYADALYNRGNALKALGRLNDAIADYEEALSMGPARVDVLNNCGLALAALNRHDNALASFDKALAPAPGYAEAHVNRALSMMVLGRLPEGWKGYEWRRRIPNLTASPRSFAQPLWHGDEPLDDRTILLHAEQGLGDTLQFVRYAPLLARRGAKVILEVQSPLAPLLSAIDGVAGVVIQGERLPAFDFHCPLLSLPLAFGTELATVPAHIPYIGAAAPEVAKWHLRLAESRTLRVGIAWAGSPGHTNDHNRSIALSRFAALFSTPHVEFVSIQRELCGADAAALRRYSNVMHIGSELGDFADTAAVISLLDVVVSVDTSLAHLAGAMGKPVWILLPFSPDFRWLLERDDSPWYPTARLFRQPQIGDWESVIERVCSALMASLTQR